MCLTAINSKEALSYSEKDVFCLAQTIYFEAKSDTIEGRKAVAFVVLNRVASEIFPNTICKVVYQKLKNVCQFSWYCDKYSDIPNKNSELWKKAKKLAIDVLSGCFVDNTENALFFHAVNINPTWFKKLDYIKTIGKHKFYRLR